MTYPAHNIDLWRAFCAWLEDRPYNASYHVPGKFSWLIAQERDNPAYLSGVAQHAAAKAAAAVRRDYQLVYWASGYGWRLHKNYREELERLAAALAGRGEG